MDCQTFPTEIYYTIYPNYLNVQKLTFVSRVVLSPKLIAAIHVSPITYVMRSADWDDQKVEFVDRILLCEDLLRRLHVTSRYAYDVNDW